MIAAILVIIFLVLGARRDRREAEERRREEEAEQLRIAREKLEGFSSQILWLYAITTKLSAFSSGYLMKKDWDAVLAHATELLNSLSQIPKAVIESSACAEQIAYITERCNDPSFREKRNERYKAHELKQCDALFSDVDGGKSLDPQQRDAVVTDEYSNLVIAGAGCGKTSVVVGKVKYLVERWGIDPSEILVTSFTNASVDDLKARIEAGGVKGVSAKTFHSLGRSILGKDFAIAEDDALGKHVTSYLRSKLASDPAQAAAFLEFFGLWSLTPSESPDSEEAEIRMRLLKAEDMRTIKGLIQEADHMGELETFHGERVKSTEELMIANFLFLNGVEYEYERPYDHAIPEGLEDNSRRAYQPDFYLSDYDIWLEHFGVDEKWRVPWMKTAFEEQDYLEGIKWKRDVHRACGTRLIESYSFWNKDQDLLNRVEALLRANGVELRIDPERNSELCGELIRDEQFFGSMRQLISTFISLVKAGNKTAPEVDDAAREAYKGNGTMWHRYDLFTRFTWPIMESYQNSLAKGPKPMVDFDDMINLAAARIRSEGFDHPYRYIIVDEYQDISLSRFGLLSAIRDATGAKLMCVGDDWQAIYRFAGSDVTLFTNFGKLVGYHEEMRIERTYRNSQKLVDVASRFVLKNPDQMSKKVKSMAPTLDRPPIAAASFESQREAFTFALNDLLSSPGGGGEIKVLGRNRHDLMRIFPDYVSEDYVSEDGFSFRDPKKGVASERKLDKVIVYRPSGRAPKEIGFMTVHKSKGLQADNVIVIGLTNSRYGFPNMAEDDPILELLLADSDRYPFAEERRLFYVALTRTKNRVWLVTCNDSGYPGISMFVDELRRESGDDSLDFYCGEDSDESVRCPRCGGVLVKRKRWGKDVEFIGCSNYPFCEKTYSDLRILEDKRKCPECGGWLTRRTNSTTGEEFFGCTNLSKGCRFTMNLDGTVGRSGYHRKIPQPSGDISYGSASYAGGNVRLPKPQLQMHPDSPTCPKCGSPMVMKYNEHGGRVVKYYRCSRAPYCDGMRSYR